ncbi:MAG: hypothetical protein KC777_28545 [Cyanobacteria bacterium HKST-UBA02]|nr:hypothetical protein [Cyanobacteria bacterium HKST-UBA02]
MVVYIWKSSDDCHLQPSEIRRRIDEGENLDFLAPLDVNEFADVAARFFKPKYLPDLEGNSLVWKGDNCKDVLEVSERYAKFVGESTVYSSGKVCTAVDMPFLAGSLGCRVFFTWPKDYLMRRPLGSAVRERIELQLVEGLDSEELSCQQVPLTEARRVEADFCIATLKLKSEGIEARFGIVFEDGLNDLGFFKVAALRINESMVWLFDYSNPDMDLAIGVLKSCEGRGDVLDSLLTALGLSTADLSWINDEVELAAHEVWRQDDNGNEFLVETLPCRADALSRVRMFTERGHKQLYWASPAGAS